MILFDIAQLEQILEREITDDERGAFIEYAACLQQPKPKEGDSGYEAFMGCRHTVYSLYQAAGENMRNGRVIAACDTVLDEYSPPDTP